MNETMKAILDQENTEFAERYEMDGCERETLMARAKELMMDYDYEYTETGLKAIFDEWLANKSWIINLLKKHPNYVEGEYYIRIPATLKRPLDRRKFTDAKDWFQEAVMKELAGNKRITIGFFDAKEYRLGTDRLDGALARLSDLSVSSYASACYGRTIDGMSTNELRAEVRRRREVFENAMRAKCDAQFSCIYGWDGKEVYVPDTDYRRTRCIYRVIDRIPFSQTFEDEDDVSRINSLLKEAGANFTIRLGQKVTKAVNKICTFVGLDKVKRIEKVHWTDANTGERHEREQDMGYNYYRAMIGDALNPVSYERDVYISVNPIDYWTMSLGYKWTSCHTFDKKNRRGYDNSYSGCHSAGTESYMLDSASVIMYVGCDEKQLETYNEKDKPVCRQSKFKRAVVYLGQDKAVIGRVYPDGRDGGDEGISSQLRNIMQEVLATCLACTNMWTIRRGYADDVISGYGPHYPDYSNCSDTVTCFLKRSPDYKNTNCIHVGHPAICPECGEEHDTEDNIRCESCQNGRACPCDYCGSYGDEDEMIEIDGNYYCCPDCANAAGYVRALVSYDEYEWHYRDECEYCDGTEEWYFGVEGYYTEDDEWFPDEETAEDWCTPTTDGKLFYSLFTAQRYHEYVKAYKFYGPGNVVILAKRDEVAVDRFSGVTYLLETTKDTAITLGDSWYVNKDSAVLDGWLFNEDGSIENVKTGEVLNQEVA